MTADEQRAIAEIERVTGVTPEKRAKMKSKIAKMVNGEK